MNDILFDEPVDYALRKLQVFGVFLYCFNISKHKIQMV